MRRLFRFYLMVIRGESEHASRRVTTPWSALKGEKLVSLLPSVSQLVDQNLARAGAPPLPGAPSDHEPADQRRDVVESGAATLGRFRRSPGVIRRWRLRTGRGFAAGSGGAGVGPNVHHTASRSGRDAHVGRLHSAVSRVRGDVRARRSAEPRVLAFRSPR
jgi:hypothetical protein